MSFVAVILQYLLQCRHWSSVRAPDSHAPTHHESAPRPVRYELNISSGRTQTIGTTIQDVLLVNDQFIGPTLRLHQGDSVEIWVRNHLNQDTAIHFHGVAQEKTPWSDGVPGLTQAPIRAGASFLYRWTASQAGTYYYHAHSKGQIMDGLYGAIVIEPPEVAERPYHLISELHETQESLREAERMMQPLLIADWSHYTFDEYLRIEQEANFDLACMDAITVNGVGSQYCLDPETLDNMTNPLILDLLKDFGEKHMTPKGCIPPIPALQGDFDISPDRIPFEAMRECVGGPSPRGNFTVDVDGRVGWAALTFVNVGGLYPLLVSIDNHRMHVYSVDGDYVLPETADLLRIDVGNRVSVFVKLDQEPARYPIRIANAQLNQILGGFAEMAYGGSSRAPIQLRPKMNYAGRPLIDGLRLFQSQDSKPFPAERKPARHADRTFKLILRKPGRPHGSWEWSLSGSELYNMTAEECDPPLLFRNTSELPRSEVVIQTVVGEWTDLILQTEGPLAQGHPIHKHGNKVYFLGSGMGTFKWSTVEDAERALPAGSLNFETPSYLDTFPTPEMTSPQPAAWAVVRYKAENPGTWLLHCHVQTHLSGGMGVVIAEGLDELPEIPLAYREWNGFERPS